MAPGNRLGNLPGQVAVILAGSTAALLAYLTACTICYQLWGRPWPTLLITALPSFSWIVLCVVSLRWPKPGGVLMLLFSGGVGGFSGQGITGILIIVGPLIVTACLFLFDARRQRVPPVVGAEWDRRYLFVIGLPVLALLVASVQWYPRLSSRTDDGLRGVRIIAGNGVTLTWVARGPGWNGMLPDGTSPSWNMLAHYGLPPVGLKQRTAAIERDATLAEMERSGLCAYLNAAGTSLLDKPMYFWRMPTADELVRSLTDDGENAGCVWDGRSPSAECSGAPDKETPLWAPDQRPIDYLVSDEIDAGHTIRVDYTGCLSITSKSHISAAAGFRCVKDFDGLKQGSIDQAIVTLLR